MKLHGLMMNAQQHNTCSAL